MNFKEIQELIRLVGKSDLAQFKMKQGDFEVNIKTNKAVKHIESAPISYVAAPTISAPVSIPASVSTKPAETAASTPVETKASTESKNYLEIKSPMVGTFYRSPGPDKAPFINIGDSVNVGSAVCIIEAMKLFNEIESEVKGTIVKVMVEDASPVEYDQVLFLVEP